jgi:hypothetical protein
VGTSRIIVSEEEAISAQLTLYEPGNRVY